MKNPSDKKLLVIELNEFSDSLLRECAEKFQLKNIQKVLNLNASYTFTQDLYESDFLEPWVQWVSVHTGKPSTDHKVKHLGDVPSLVHPQLWESLSEKGVQSNIWGVLNGSRGQNSENVRVFFPDLWTFSEKAHPSELNALLTLPRYVAQNRVRFSFVQFTKHFLSFGVFLAKKGKVLEVLRNLPSLTNQIVRFGVSEYAGFCFLEYLMGLLFIDYWKKERPAFSILFLNSVAHLQHYYWEKDRVGENERFRYGFSYIDRMLGKLLAEVGTDTHIMMVNGLSQMNTNAEKAWVSYRPIDHGKFLHAAGCDFSRVEPLMSYDALVFFSSPGKCEEAKRILSSAMVNEQKLFLVETYPEEPEKLFYRFQFTDPVESSAFCEVGGKQMRFGEYFKKIIVRTGKHIPAGNVYTSLSDIPKRIENHQLFDWILRFFAPSQSREMSRSPKVNSPLDAFLP